MPICREVFLSLICTFHYPPNFDFTSSIKEFFQIERIIAIDDVIKVDLNDTDIHKLLEDFKTAFMFTSEIKVVVLSIETFEKSVAGLLCNFDRDLSKMSIKFDVNSYRKVFNANIQDELIVNCNFHDSLEPVIQLGMLQSKIGLHENFSKPRLVHVLGDANSGKGNLIRRACDEYGLMYHEVSFCDPVETELDRLASLMESADFVGLHLQDFDHLFRNTEYTLSFNCEFDDRNVMQLRRGLLKLFHVVSKHRRELVCFISTRQRLPAEIAQFVVFEHSLTEGLGRDDCCHLMQQFLGSELICQEELTKMCQKIPSTRLLQLLRLASQDDNKMDLLAVFKSCLGAVGGDSIGAVEKVGWSDIGGLDEVVAEVIAAVRVALGEHKPVPGVSGRKRRSRCTALLLYGPPGTGKTLLARVVAAECALNFISVKGPELINPYVGQTELNVRRLFQRASRLQPCLIFCDELDSLAADSRGRSADSGGVMDRVVSQLATELDACRQSGCDEEGGGLVILAATNRPDLIDPALLRNGRFDKVLHVGPREGGEASDGLGILRAQTRKLKLAAEVNLERVAKEWGASTLVGADIRGKVSAAVMKSIRRQVAAVETADCVPDQEIIVEMADFLEI